MNWSDIKISSKSSRTCRKRLIVLEKRYLAKDDKGKPWKHREELFRRVAKFVASADFLYGKKSDEVNRTADDYYDIMSNLEFMPNTPTLMNPAGPGPALRCFVLPVKTRWIKSSTRLKHGSHTQERRRHGFSFSRLRPRMTSSKPLPAYQADRSP